MGRGSQPAWAGRRALPGYAPTGTVTDVSRRVRIRPPGGLFSWYAALVAAGYLGIVGAALAVKASGFPTPPTEAQAIAVATAAVPGQPHNMPAPPVHWELVDCPGWDGRDDTVAYAETPNRADQTAAVFFRVSWEQAPAVLRQAHDRLAAAGWRVSGVRRPRHAAPR